jgi:hypothetical protein
MVYGMVTAILFGKGLYYIVEKNTVAFLSSKTPNGKYADDYNNTGKRERAEYQCFLQRRLTG